MLEIKDLAVQYGKQPPFIEHFNLSMKKGEIISVVGESGSGKTTVIRAVLGALAGGGKVTSGDILFQGKSLLNYSKEEWREQPDAEIKMKKVGIFGIARNNSELMDSAIESVSGKEDILSVLTGSLAEFPPYFNIIEP